MKSEPGHMVRYLSNLALHWVMLRRNHHNAVPTALLHTNNQVVHPNVYSTPNFGQILALVKESKECVCGVQ